MLAKLMKYDLKATSRLLVPLYLILLVISIINRFTFKLDQYDGVIKIIFQFLLVIYVTTIIVILIITALYMIIRFYKNLLTDEGYLMFTLPAKTHQLITSKLLVTMFWIIASFIAILISLFIVFATPVTLPAAINGLKEAIATGEFGGNWVLIFTEIFIMFLLGLVSNILLIYASIAIGQLFSKHKIIGSFAAYMVIYTAIQFLMIIVIAIFGAAMSQRLSEFTSLPQMVLPTSIVVLILGSSCFYFTTNFIFKRKLNID